MNRQELDGSDAELADVLDHFMAHQSSECPTQVRRHRRVEHRVALDVGLVQNRTLPGNLRASLFAPGKGRVDHTAFGHEGSAVALVKRKVALRRPYCVPEQRGVPYELADDLLGIWVQQELVRVEAMSFCRGVGTVHAIAIDLARPRVRKIAVPYLIGILGKLDPLDFLLGFDVKETELDLGCMSREQREVDAEAVPGCSQREGASFLDAVLHNGWNWSAGIDGRHLVHERPLGRQETPSGLQSSIC